MRDVGSIRGNNRIGVEASATTSRLSNQMNFSSGPSSCSRFSPHMAENGIENAGRRSPDNARMGNSNDANRCYIPSIPNDWNNSTFNGLKRNRDGDMKMFSSSNGLDTQVVYHFWIVSRISLFAYELWLSGCYHYVWILGKQREKANEMKKGMGITNLKMA